MPTYDYNCLDCRKRFDVFMTYSEYGTRPVTCSHCGSENVRRRVPRVRVLKSDESRMESLDNPSALEAMSEDPRAMARMMRELGDASGEEMPPQFDEIVGRLEDGQSAEEIESSMPDWGGDGSGAESFGEHDHSGHTHSDD